MTLEELLKSQGIGDEQVTGILNAMKENEIYTASEENLDLRYGKLKTEHDSLVAKDAESQKLISDLQKATKGQEEIQNQISLSGKGFYMLFTYIYRFGRIKRNVHLRKQFCIAASVIEKRWDVFIHIIFQQVFAVGNGCFIFSK